MCVPCAGGDLAGVWIGKGVRFGMEGDLGGM